MKNEKKKIKFIIIVLFILICLAVLIGGGIILFLYSSGWYDEKVETSTMSFKIDNISYDDFNYLTDSTSDDNAYGLFVYFEGMETKCEINAVIEQGSLTIQLINLKDSPAYFEGESYEVISEMTTDETGWYEFLINEDTLTPGDGYALYIYGSEDCEVTADFLITYYIYRWQMLHDEKLTVFPWVEEKYLIQSPLEYWSWN